jgi:hypothetical protein
VDYRAAFSIIQPTYNGDSFTNDMALIRLTSPVTFGQFVKPICLPSGPPVDGVSDISPLISHLSKTQASLAFPQLKENI